MAGYSDGSEKCFLFVAIEAKNPSIPGITKRLPAESGSAEYRPTRQLSREYALGIIQLAGGGTSFQKEIQSQIHAIRSDDSSGIDSFPSAIWKPNFAPGMSISLSYEKEVPNLIIFPA